MKNFRQFFLFLSYFQYLFLRIALYSITKPTFKGFEFISPYPAYLFRNYSKALIGFGSTQDASKTSFKYEKGIWKPVPKAHFILQVRLHFKPTY